MTGHVKVGGAWKAIVPTVKVGGAHKVVAKGYVKVGGAWKEWYSSATPWTPSQLTTALWLDANDSGTITLNGSNVSQWNDKSGNGRNYAQGTAANQPAYSTTAYNSKPGLTFDGGDWLTRSTTGTSTASATVAFVIDPVNTTGTQFLLDFQTGRLLFAHTNGAGLSPAMYIESGYFGPTSAGSSAQQVLVFETQATTGGIWQNGTRIYTGGYNSMALNGASAIGARHSTFASPYSGVITEIVVCQSALSDTDRQKLEGYLAWKWGNESLLPNDHPYKSAAPVV